jgi:hypothetical protein
MALSSGGISLARLDEGIELAVPAVEGLSVEGA